MAEQWISAAVARDLVTGGLRGDDGLRSLRTRAHRGLVKAKARVLIKRAVHTGETATHEDEAPVPVDLWSPHEPEQLDQNWAIGDFSRSGLKSASGYREQVQALGVSFAADGVLDVLPFEERASVARGLSVAGSPAWMSAREVSRAAEKAISSTEPNRWVFEQARLGFVTGRAVLAQRFEHRQAAAPVWEGREWDIPEWFWVASLEVRQG